MRAGEIAAVCERYALGDVRSVRPFDAGSPANPKAVLATSTGRYLLKRRAGGPTIGDRVAFSHELQLYLADRGLPVAELIGTRDDNNTITAYDGSLYELHRLAPGLPAGKAPGAEGEAQCVAAGAALAALHAATADFVPSWPAPEGGYEEDADAVARLNALADALPQGPRRASLRTLGRAARRAFDRVAAWARGAAPSPTVIHGDWHPGNVLVEAGRVSAVVDFDSARRGRPEADLALALTQFSITGRGAPSASWRPEPDIGRFTSFATGYHDGQREHAAARPPIEIESLTSLMVASIACEASALAVDAKTCSDAVLEGIAAKADWLERESNRLESLLRQTL